MKKMIFFVMALIFVFSCEEGSDSCTGNTILDRRIGLMASPSYGLCIQKTCDEENSEPCCSSGIIEEGKCLSGIKAGEECSVIADCESSAPICLSDPQIVGTFIEKGTEMGIELTAEMLTDILGLNYCTVMDCDPDIENPADPENPVTCPENMSCSDSLSGTSTGVFICQKNIIEETPDKTSDVDEDNETDDLDTDSVEDYACMENECTAHEDCPADSCDATFCTGELPVAVLGDGPKVCVVRCDPESPECPDGLECNGGIAFLEDDVKDGAKGICIPPDSIIFRRSK